MRPVTKVILVLSVVAVCVVAIWFVTQKLGTRLPEPSVTKGPAVTATTADPGRGSYNDPLTTYQRWRQTLTGGAVTPTVASGHHRPGNDIHSSSLTEGTVVAHHQEDPVAGADPPGPTVRPTGVEGDVVPSGWTMRGAAGNTYTIASGDTLAAISRKVYGDAKYASAIEAANAGINPRALKIGQQIVIPDKASIVKPPAAPVPVATVAGGTVPAAPVAPAAPTAKVYEVQKNDTLIGIARRIYGDAAMYRKIYEANQDVLTSPNATLRLGQRLRLPES